MTLAIGGAWTVAALLIIAGEARGREARAALARWLQAEVW